MLQGWRRAYQHSKLQKGRLQTKLNKTIKPGTDQTLPKTKEQNKISHSDITKQFELATGPSLEPRNQEQYS